MAAEAIKNAGKKHGLEVWRVVNMDLEEVPKEQHGNFFTGDAYILLNTLEKGKVFSYKVHSWAGENASMDERGAAAIFMTQLDCHLGGSPVQFTEFQYEESKTFMGYFKHGIKYKKGGAASGFNHVDRNEKVLVVLRVKGRRAVRGLEVDPKWSSFNSGDCFIIDLGENIYLWAGSDCNRYERLKAVFMCNNIRDNERNGRAEIHFIDEGEEPEEVIKALGPKPDKLDSGTCDIHIPAPLKEMSEASLYLISNAGGSMKETLVAEKNPFKQDDLKRGDCYIVDNKGNHKIFIWKGREANQAERDEALKTAEKFIEVHKLPERTQVIALPDGGETTLFKEFFLNWVDKDESSCAENTETQVQKAKRRPRLYACSNKTGELIAEEVLGELSQLDLATDDIMILDTRDQIYVWIGRDANDAEKAGVGKIVADFVGVRHCSERETITIQQGQEPASFTGVFKTWDPDMWDRDMAQLVSQFSSY